MVRGLIISLLFAASLHAQILSGIMNVQSATVAGVTPAVASVHSGSSTGTNSLTTLVSGTNTCAAYTYCTSLPQPLLSGNGIVVFVTYQNATTVSFTVTDDKSDTLTHASCEGHETSANQWADVYYILPGSVTAGARGIKVKSGTTAVTWVAVATVQVYNINAYDTCGTAASASTVSTYTGGALTTTASNDLIFQYVANTTTSAHQNTGTFVNGSGYTKLTSDRRDGSALQYSASNSSGSNTPSMTTGTANTYVSVDVAFKSGTAGTAQSGMYIFAEQHQSSAVSGSETSWVYDMPSAGANLLVTAQTCGGTTPMTVTAISDGTNTWRESSPDVFTDQSNYPNLVSLWYAANSTGSSNLTLTYTVTGTGDCSAAMYAIAGAATSPLVAHQDECSGSFIGGWTCADGITDIGAGTPLSPLATNSPAGFYPGNNSGIVIGTMGLSFNTAISVSSPSGALFDADTNGGENMSGPWPVDENNGTDNFTVASNTAETVSYGLTSASTDPNTMTALRDSFASATATLSPSLVGAKTCHSGAGTSPTTCAYTPHKTGNVIALFFASGGTSGNITVADSASNTIAAGYPASGTACTNVTNGCFRSYYIASVNTASSDTFTVTWATPNAYETIYIMELSGVTTLDAKLNGTTTSGGSGVTSSVSVTAAQSSEIMVGANLCSGTCNVGSGSNMGRFDGTGTSSSAGQESLWKILTSSGSGQVLNFVDASGTGLTEGSAVMTFY